MLGAKWTLRRGGGTVWPKRALSLVWGEVKSHKSQPPTKYPPEPLSGVTSEVTSVVTSEVDEGKNQGHHSFIAYKGEREV